MVTARIAACGAGFCVLLAVYGTGLHVDVVTPPPHSPVVATDAAWIAAVREGRQRGAADAPLGLSIVIDAQCQTCADTWPALDRALAPLVGAHQVHLSIGPLVRPSEPASAVLADCLDAAAAGGPARHARALRALLGTRAGISSTAALATDPAQAIDAPALARIVADHATALATLRADDARWLAAMSPATHGNVVTPFAVLVDASGREVARWSGAALDPAAVVEAIKAAGASASATGPASATSDHPAAPTPEDHP
jgi:hypothetical protein